MNEKVWKVNCLWILVLSLTMTGIANAACTPTPDCASIGYTETSCDEDFVRCPFDISKLLCLPCDSKYQYDCSGANIAGGVGSSCGGKYVSCTCLEEGEFNNGKCPQNCTVGMIYYSDKSCSEEMDTSKTIIGVVVKDNELVMSKDNISIAWSSTLSKNTPLTDLTQTRARDDYNGKSNTEVIVTTYQNDNSSNNAAIYCSQYSTTGTKTGDWYLPAAGELYDVVLNYKSLLTPVFVDYLGWPHFNNWFWSSSESDWDNAWIVIFSDRSMKEYTKTSTYSVTCFLDIS